MRRSDSVADALGRTARYGSCPRRERQAISQISTVIDVPAGAVLARQGQLGREFAIVLTGGANVLTGGRVTSALLAGDHFGEVALLDGGRNPATVLAATPMRLAVVAANEFAGLLDCSPAVARSVLISLASTLRSAYAA
jgi:CRP/FNR family transcriptional regulator, cyclic AMP receptor protein